jgi:uncharacterized protein (TIGR02680 family)
VTDLTDHDERTADRFRPTRAGVINLWDYRDEEFVFADGRLVLRGPNGSGKTKALEVLFPFVLDGRIEPRRLNPFAGEDRTMKSNLLYRKQDAAYAYVWLEFARTPDDVVTIGVGMRAQRHNDKVTRWYFVVDGRVGVDFSLLGPDDRPLTRKQLGAQLGADVVTDRAVEHRAAVDARLFGLGAERYEQLLTLVLTLRRPQLAKHLDPKGLSRTLSDGLRPLDDELITEAARSFDDMEAVQRTLDGLVQADDAAAVFLGLYTTYLRTHARATADAVSRRRSDVEHGRVQLASALGTRTAAIEARDRAEAVVTEADLALGKHRAALDALQRSTAFQQHKGDLDQLTELVGKLGHAARQQRAAAGQATATAVARHQDTREAQAKLGDARQEVTRAAAELADDATDAGIEWNAADAEPDDRFGERVNARAMGRVEDVQALRAALQALREANRDRQRHETAFGTAEQQVAEAEVTERSATDQLDGAKARVRDALLAWDTRHSPALTELGVAGPLDALVAVLHLVGEPDAPTLESTLDELTNAASQSLRAEAHRQSGERDRRRAELADLHEQRQKIAEEQDDAPEPFAARSASRAERAGAPLWRLVRFADNLPAEHATAIEAALAAANILDAWVDPDDAVTEAAIDTGRSDGYLIPLPPDQRPTDRTLAEALVPEEDTTTGITPARVTAILSSIALLDTDNSVGAAQVAPVVSLGGGFAQGIQVGTHTKSGAEFVGATARQHRRERRLAELDAQIEQVIQAVAELDATIDQIETVLGDVATARKELPRTGPIALAMRAVADAGGVLRERRNVLDTARRNLDQAVAEIGDRQRRLARTAAEHHIAPEPDTVEAIAAAVDRFQRSATTLATARAAEQSRADALLLAERLLTEADDNATDLLAKAEDAEREHAEQAEGLATLRESVGDDVDKVLRDIGDAKERIRTTETELKRLHEVHNKAGTTAGQAIESVTGARATLVTAIAEAQAEAHRLAPYAHREILDLLRVPTGPVWPGSTQDWLPPVDIVAEAEPTLTDEPNAHIAALPATVARLHDAIQATTAELSPSESSLKSTKTRLSTALDALQAQLSAAGHDYHPEWEADQDVIVVRVADETGYTPIVDFARRITAARRDQEQLLTDSERRILEDALLGRLAQQIHERTVDARDLIDRMSSEMRTRRMSSGTTVGVHWELSDGLDDEQRAISRLLDRDASRLGPDHLADMRTHFASRIKTARAQHPDRSYSDLLADVLDYRRWRTFAFSLIDGRGTEERLTQARHSTLSGGEQSVSLHLPLFAAAHVTLSSAQAHCPRLLALDEAFAGIDDTGRRELLGLTAEFDLDLFMTGYDLWATYETVPACAHYDLSHSATEHTVSALLLVWDGGELLADGTEDLAAALGSPGTRRRPTSTDTPTLESSADEDEE